MPFLPSKLGNNLKRVTAQDSGKCRSWGAWYQKGPIGRRNFFISASDSLWLYQSSSSNTLHLPEHVPHSTPHMSDSIPARTNVKAVCYSSSSSLIISKLWTVTDCWGELPAPTGREDLLQLICGAKRQRARDLPGRKNRRNCRHFILQGSTNPTDCMKLLCKGKYERNRGYLQFHRSHWNATGIFRRLRKKGIIYVYLEDTEKARREGRKILFCRFWDQASGLAK